MKSVVSLPTWVPRDAFFDALDTISADPQLYVDLYEMLPDTTHDLESLLVEDPGEHNAAAGEEPG